MREGRNITGLACTVRLLWCSRERPVSERGRKEGSDTPGFTCQKGGGGEGWERREEIER